jgi:hypothetical protein
MSDNLLLYRGTYKGNLINLPHKDIIRCYNAIIRGIFGYYCIVYNNGSLIQIIFLLLESCGLTLARKYKFHSIQQVCIKYGINMASNLTNPLRIKKKIGLFIPNYYGRVPIKE